MQPSIDGTEPMYIHRTSTGKFKIDQPVTVIDWASVPSLLTVSYNRMFLVDQEGPFTLGLAKKVVPAGGLMRPSAVLSWQQRISFAAYNNFRLTVMTFPNVIPKISKKKKLKVLKCQPGWTFFDKRCYKILEEPRNGDAFSMEVACTSLPGRNARLTSIGSLDEHDFLYDMAPPNSNTWVGSVYTLPTVNGVMVQPDLGWFWTDLKTPWNFTYWAEGEPGNDGGSTLCLALRKTDEAEQKNNGWVAMDCMNKNYGICRKAAKKKTAKPTKPPTPYPTLSPSPEPTPVDTTTGSVTGSATETGTGAPSLLFVFSVSASALMQFSPVRLFLVSVCLFLLSYWRVVDRDRSSSYSRRWSDDRRRWVVYRRYGGVGHHHVSNRMGWHDRDNHGHGRNSDWLVNCDGKWNNCHWPASYSWRWRNDWRHWVVYRRYWGVGHHHVSNRMGWHYRDNHGHGCNNNRDCYGDIYRSTRDNRHRRQHRRHRVVHHGHWRVVHNLERHGLERHHRNRQRDGNVNVIRNFKCDGAWRRDKHWRRCHRHRRQRNRRRLATSPLSDDAPP